MKLYHLADLHLGRKSNSPLENARRMNALRNAISVAAAENVDAILVAGDVFDSPNVELSVVHVSARTMDSAKDSSGNSIPVVIIPGNHDPSDSHRLWDHFQDSLRPDSLVTLALEPTLIKPFGAELVIEAYPCQHRYSPTAPWNERLKVSEKTSSTVHVVLAHGTLQGGIVPEGHSDSHPFTKRDASELDADYVALGHFHSVYPAWSGGDAIERRISYAGTHEPDRFGLDAGYGLLVELAAGQPARIRRSSVAVSQWRLVRLAQINDLEILEGLKSEIESSEDPSQFKVRIQPCRNFELTQKQLEAIERLEDGLRALGADIERRGEFDLSIDLDDLVFDRLPTGALAETLVELKSELQTTSDPEMLPLIREAIQLGWHQLGNR